MCGWKQFCAYLAPLSYNTRVEAVLLLPCVPLCGINTHQSYDAARLRAQQNGELMCGSVVRKTFHKVE